MNTSRVVELRVQGIGPVPSKKNNKMITRGRLITNPKYQTWSKSCVQSFVSQLCSITATFAAETSTVACPRSLMLSLLPEDDSWTWIPEINVRAVKCTKGKEGATITIEQI